MFGVLWGSRYQRVRDTEGLKKSSVRSTVELEITEGSRYRGVEKPSVWSTVELEITEGTRYRRVKKTECSEYYGARDNRGSEIPWG